MTKRNGFVALLDVLGFSALIASENSSARLETYQRLLAEAIRPTAPSRVEAVAFSDSIVLTTGADSAEDFVELATRCAVLHALMLQQGIALRGAISSGSYFREVMENSVFIAGRPIVEAFKYECLQDWVGIMVTPAVVQKFPDIGKRVDVTRGLTDPTIRVEFTQRFRWAAAIQPADEIPFKGNPKPYQGFAVVPHTGTNARDIYNGVEASRIALYKLRAVAPDPVAQEKYTRAERWLSNVAGKWAGAAEEMARSGAGI
jgi:hypothetical protein